MHLAELNITSLKYPIDDPRVADFADNLDRVNRIAENMPGFMWRNADEIGSANTVHVFNDPMVIVNMSVWETVEELERFVWQTVHKRFYDRRAEWFELMKSSHFVMWWVEKGHLPTLREARERLDSLNEHGNSDFAFDWSHLPQVKLWQKQRCA